MATAIFSRILTAVVIIVMLLFSSSGLVQILPVTGQSNVNVSSNLTGTNLTNSNASNASLVSPGNITKLGKDNQTVEEKKLVDEEDQKIAESKESTSVNNEADTTTKIQEKCIPDPDNPSSCESEKVSPSQSTKNESEIPVPKKGDPPTANAGPDIVLRHGNETKKLDGTASSDPDGLIVSYNWRLQESQGGCPSLQLNDDDKSVATIINGPDIPTKNCNYNYQLKVRDDTGLEDTDGVRVKVECVSPPSSSILPPCEDEIQKEQKSEPTTALKLKSNFKVIVQVVNRYNGSKSPSDFTVHITTSPGRHAIPDTFRGVDAPGQPVLFSGPVDNRTGPELYTVDGWAPGLNYNDPPEFIGQCGATPSRAYDVPPPPGEEYCKITIRDSPLRVREGQAPMDGSPNSILENMTKDSSTVPNKSNATYKELPNQALESNQSRPNFTTQAGPPTTNASAALPGDWHHLAVSFDEIHVYEDHDTVGDSEWYLAGFVNGKGRYLTDGWHLNDDWADDPTAWANLHGQIIPVNVLEEYQLVVTVRGFEYDCGDRFFPDFCGDPLPRIGDEATPFVPENADALGTFEIAFDKRNNWGVAYPEGIGYWKIKSSKPGFPTAYADYEIKFRIIDCDYPGNDTFCYGPRVTPLPGPTFGTNSAPVANSQTVTTNKNTAKTITLTATDPDNDPLTFSIVTQPAHGTITGGTGSSRIYTPATDFVGRDCFTFKANDGTVDSNTAEVCVTVQNIASGSCATNHPIRGVTASNNDGNVPSNVLDNNFNTRWSSDGVGQWIRADLGSTKSVCEVDIAWYKGNERVNNFVISTSIDGTTFTNVFSGSSSGTTLNSEKYIFEPVNARYVKITVFGNSVNTWASITELDIFG